MATVRIDISKLKHQKNTLKSFVFLSETMRMQKGGEFNSAVLSLPKSLTTVINQRTNLSNQVVPTIVEIPKWLFDKNVTGNKKLEAKIRVL